MHPPFLFPCSLVIPPAFLPSFSYFFPLCFSNYRSLYYIGKNILLWKPHSTKGNKSSSKHCACSRNKRRLASLRSDALSHIKQLNKKRLGTEGSTRKEEETRNEQVIWWPWQSGVKISKKFMGKKRISSSLRSSKSKQMTMWGYFVH